MASSWRISQQFFGEASVRWLKTNSRIICEDYITEENMRCILLSAIAFCCLWRGTTAGTIKHTSLLDNDDNAQKIFVLSDAGQSLDKDDSSKLLSFEKPIGYGMNVCCFYGNILDFYVSDVLNTSENLPYLITSALLGNDQELVRRFKEQFRKMGRPGVYKAVGELSSLVYDLHLYC
ncbi:hypothetical protein GJAV_G00156780 [Gymnothorax javanicus]|nr:hypothetical protein GJAV_G00156780 [Gymnothorax javanicus]